jgi:transcriptional regulator with XRE-family HTH domain
MANIREILAQNLKENRRKLGITQPMLAERAGLSTHYLGMIEIGRNFPTADVLERLAEALGVNSNELFSVSVSPERAIEELQQAVVKNIDQLICESMERVYQTTAKNLEQVVADAIDRNLTAKCKGKE